MTKLVYPLGLIIGWDGNTLRLNAKETLLLQCIQSVAYELIETQNRLIELTLKMEEKNANNNPH